MKKLILSIIFLIFCSSSFASSKIRISQNLVAGVIGCPAKSITISDYSASSKNPLIVSAHTFTATCNNVKYYCSYLYPSPVTCKEDVNSLNKSTDDIFDELEEMKRWKTKVLDKAIRHWKKPESLDGMSDSEITVRVDSQGQLLNLHWVQTTNNRKIDRSIVNAFKDASPFAIPPDATEAFNGVSIIFPTNPKP